MVRSTLIVSLPSPALTVTSITSPGSKIKCSPFRVMSTPPELVRSSVIVSLTYPNAEYWSPLTVMEKSLKLLLLSQCGVKDKSRRVGGDDIHPIPGRVVSLDQNAVHPGIIVPGLVVADFLPIVVGRIRVVGVRRDVDPGAVLKIPGVGDRLGELVREADRGGVEGVGGPLVLRVGADPGKRHQHSYGIVIACRIGRGHVWRGDEHVQRRDAAARRRHPRVRVAGQGQQLVPKLRVADRRGAAEIHVLLRDAGDPGVAVGMVLRQRIQVIAARVN